MLIFRDSRRNHLPPPYLALYSEDGPPTEIADVLQASLPFNVTKPILQRATQIIRDADRFDYLSSPTE